jgi:uncharacterized UPF0160 family protein
MLLVVAVPAFVSSTGEISPKRDVTNLITFYFEKWQETHQKSQIFHVCFHFFEKTIRQKRTNTLCGTRQSHLHHIRVVHLVLSMLLWIRKLNV